jgi:hypothetical protein
MQVGSVLTIVTARNVLLWALLIDYNVDEILMRLWNIYYHFMIDDASLALLTVQCSRLVEVSSDITTWNASAYSAIIRVCNSYTLSELHRLWSSYKDMQEWTETRRNAFKTDFVDTMHKIGTKTGQVTTGMRNAGPFFALAAKDVADIHANTWKTGTVALKSRDIRQATNVNPTFAHASRLEGFVAHYGTSPVTAYPIAHAYVNTSTTGKASTVKTDNIVSKMQSDFRTWCEAFRNSVKVVKNVTVRIVVGDVLSICRTLQRLSGTGAINSVSLPVKAWNASPLTFDDDSYVPGQRNEGASAPILFDIVDTSNLSDHIGLLNILLVTAPLLKRTPYATLNTETLLARGQDPTRSFADRLCGDISTMSLLLDLLPVNFISGFSTHSNVHELIS